jgi:uncharacterized protein (TIGR00369 family)
MRPVEDLSSGASSEPLSAVRSDHHCFGCGALNPIGLRLQFAIDAHGVRAAFVPSAEHQGFETIVHGGIISTVLDEAMAWATAAAGIWAVTASMQVRFLRPLHVGELATVTASVSGTRARLVTTTATLASDADGLHIAMATGTFMRVDEQTEAAWRARYLERHPSDNIVGGPS